jgi:hypothetical protein
MRAIGSHDPYNKIRSDSELPLPAFTYGGLTMPKQKKLTVTQVRRAEEIANDVLECGAEIPKQGNPAVLAAAKELIESVKTPYVPAQAGGAA